MKLDSQTPHAELERLFMRLTLAEFLRNTPINLRLFARYAVLFVLFPSMVLGFRAGLGIMLAFCAGMLAVMLAGQDEWAYAAVKLWLLAGVVVYIGVVIRTTLSAARRMRESRSPRPAERPLTTSSSPTPCGVLPMPWQKERDGFAAQMTLCADQAGVYALMIELQDCGRGRLMAEGTRGLCCPRRSGRGNHLELLALLRLEAGEHILRWRFAGADTHCPRGTVTLLCRPGNHS